MNKRNRDEEYVFTISDFLTVEGCTALIARSEQLGYEPATIGPVEVVPEYRNNDRVLFTDFELAGSLFQRARPFLPPQFEGELAGFNERFRCYRYDPGQMFKRHFDGSVQCFETGNVSRLTFMIYLNDDFLGGGTNFFHQLGRSLPYLSVQPTRGQALVFVHRLIHEGAPVEQGRKYVLRTDVMYREAGD